MFARVQRLSSVSYQELSINRGNIIIICGAHVKEAQYWIIIFGLGMNGVGSMETLAAYLYMPVMPSDACSSCLVCVCVRTATQALHECFGAILSPGFLQCCPKISINSD